MLSKCANPHCRSLFRYLHEGRLYVIGPKDALGRHKPTCRSGQMEYAWLCSSCSRYLTIEVDEEFGTRVIRKRETRNGRECGSSANHGITDIA